MRTQLVAARSVAEALVYLALNDGSRAGRSGRSPARARSAWPTSRDWSRRTASRSRRAAAIGDADGALYESGALLPGPDARLAGPTFEEWLAKVA